MQLLHKAEILASLSSIEEESIFIDPILDSDQIGAVSVDIRLGYDFFVSILTRKPFIQLAPSQDSPLRSVASYFQETRREFGEKFILYPNQTVISTSLEYLSLPSNVYADLLTRSSYNRLGISLNTMIQPGFRGCFPIELHNNGNNAIELIVGSRLFQARFFRIDGNVTYFENARKYYGDIRPTVSKADKDNDIERLSRINLS